MRPRPEVLEALAREVRGAVRPGDALIVTGPVGLAGTLELLESRRELLESRFSPGFLRRTERAASACLAGGEEASASLWQYSGAVPLGAEGVLAALWKLAEVSSVGLSVDLRRIPIRQETVELCELADQNPYRLSCGCGWLFGTSHGTEARDRLRQAGRDAEIVGFVTDGTQRLLYVGDRVRFLERPESSFDRQTPCE